ncbi:MAG: hypothetical protein NTW94_02585 [Legionellales bacterium]|nr:hypothetical protein [Legionellales bacterium]
MKFFVGFDVVEEYPDTKPELQARVIHDALHKPQKIAISFFSAYFANGGGREHPILGDLLELAHTIKLRWNTGRTDLNLVAETIEHQVYQSMSPQESKSPEF